MLASISSVRAREPSLIRSRSGERSMAKAWWMIAVVESEKAIQRSVPPRKTGCVYPSLVGFIWRPLALASRLRTAAGQQRISVVDVVVVVL